jgi:minor curlin subunit
MKNTSLFMMFTLLGVPGFVTAAFRFKMLNITLRLILSLSSLNQAAIIGQQGLFNDARPAKVQTLSIVSQDGVKERELINQGYNIAWIDQSGNANDAGITQEIR